MITEQQLTNTFDIPQRTANILLQQMEYNTVYDVFNSFISVLTVNNNMKEFTIEEIISETEWINDIWENTIALFINTGDTLDETLIYDVLHESYIIEQIQDLFDKYDNIFFENDNLNKYYNIKENDTKIISELNEFYLNIDNTSDSDIDFENDYYI